MPEAEVCVNEKNLVIPGRIAYIIEELSDDEAGEVLKAIVHTFAIGNFCEPGDGMARVVFTLLLDELRKLNPRTEE